jgi:hypothetical protein
VSVFFHITRWPTFSVVGLGANDWLPLMPVMLIVTSGPGLDGEGEDGLELLPQALNANAAAMIAKANDFVMRRHSASRVPPPAREKCRDSMRRRARTSQTT